MTFLSFPTAALRRRRARALALAAFVLFDGMHAGPILAQHRASPLRNMHHTRWSAGRDLPVADVNRIARTPDGYLWLGSSAGLVRFDGVRFVVLNGATVPELGSDVIGGIAPLMVDRTGVLWIGLADGSLVNYDAGTFRVTPVRDSNMARISAMAEDRMGGFWLWGNGRLSVWRDGQIEDPALRPELNGAFVMGVTPDSGNGVWVGTRDQGLWHVTPDGARRETHPHPPGDAAVLPVRQMRDGSLWISGIGAQVLARNKWNEIRLNGRSLVGTKAAEATDGSVYIGTTGSGILHLADGMIEQFSVADGLTGAVVNDVLLDAEGNLWATTESGLDRFRPAAFVTIGSRRGLPFETPMHIFGDSDGSVWAVDYARHTAHIDGGIIRGTGATIDVSPASGADIPFARSRRGGVWSFRLHSDLVYLLRDGGNTTVRASPGLVWTGPRIGFEDHNGVFWLGAGAGGFGRVRDFAYESFPIPGLGPAPRIASMIGDDDGRLWVSISEPAALVVIDGDTVVGRFDGPTDISGPLRHLAHEGGDTLWATVSQGRLVRLIGGRSTVLSIPELETALAAESVVLIPSHSYLWFGSQGGIGRIPLRELHGFAETGETLPSIEWFSELDGLEVPRTARDNANAGFMGEDGRIWFATPAGLAVVDPDRVPSNPVPPTPLIEEVRITGMARPVRDGDEIGPNPQRLEFHYTAASLRTPERVRIEYRLDGADPDWNPSETIRTATYTQLRPGHYRFRVRASNESGVASIAEASLAFRVLPAWYQARWFLVLAVLGTTAALSITVAAWLRARNRAQAARIHERYQAALNERTRLARELHDTLLQGFTGITLQLQALQRTITEAPREAASALSSILTMADRALREARQAVWDMRAPELEDHDLAEALQSVATRAIGREPIALAFEAHGKPRQLPLSIETTVLRIGREAATNAIQHAGATHLSITLTYESERVGLRVQDDGRGFEPDAMDVAARGGHWGLRGMQERAMQAGGQLAITSTHSGTTIELSLPASPLISG